MFLGRWRCCVCTYVIEVHVIAPETNDDDDVALCESEAVEYLGECTIFAMRRMIDVGGIESWRWLLRNS